MPHLGLVPSHRQRSFLLLLTLQGPVNYSLLSLSSSLQHGHMTTSPSKFLAGLRAESGEKGKRPYVTKSPVFTRHEMGSFTEFHLSISLCHYTTYFMKQVLPWHRKWVTSNVIIGSRPPSSWAPDENLCVWPSSPHVSLSWLVWYFLSFWRSLSSCEQWHTPWRHI